MLRYLATWSGKPMMKFYGIRSYLILRILLLIPVLTGIISAGAQIPKIKKLPLDHKGTKLQVHCIEQAGNGFVWLGTNQGLLKFDGIQHTVLHAGDSIEEIISLKIFQNHLFVGFSNGTVSELDLATEKIIRVLTPTESPVNDLLLDSKGRLWLATYGDGVFLIDGAKTIHLNTENGLSDDQTYSLANATGRDEVLVATDYGINIMVYSGSDMTCRSVTEEHGLPDNLVTTLLAMDNGNFVVGSQSGIVCNYNVDSNSSNLYRAFEGFESSCINDMCAVGSEIWIATESHGILSCTWPASDDLQRYKIEDWKVNTTIRDILPDLEGNIIVASSAPELVVIDTRLSFVQIHEAVDFSNIQAILCDRGGNIWFSTADGLYQHSSNFVSRNTLKIWMGDLDKKGIRIMSLYEDSNGDIWFGTFDKGVGRIRRDDGSTQWYTEKDGLVNNNVLSICGKSREIWFATLGGVSRIPDGDNVTFSNFDANSPLGSSYIYSVYCDNKERVWFGTDGKGPAYYDGDEFHLLRQEFPDLSKTVVSIAEDLGGNIWFYGGDKKLFRYDGKKIVQHIVHNEGNEVEIFAIHGDDLGSLVIFSSEGVAILDPVKDDLQFIEKNVFYNANYLNAISKDPQGQFWIGAENALIRLREINPGKATTPITAITAMYSFLEPVDTSLGLKFSSNKNHVAFEFCGLWFRDPEKVKYQYRLDGYSLEWTSTRDNFIIFPQLPPGDYVFRVKSSVGSKFDNSDEAAIAFTIRQPFWKTPWFIALVTLFILLLFTFLYRVRLANIRRHESIHRERIQSQFDTLKNQINPHFLFNSLNTLISLISREKDLAIDYVEKLSDYFRMILEQQEKDIIPLKEELKLVQYYFYLQQKRFGDNLQLITQVTPEAMRSTVPPLTLQILAENAIKHNIISRSKPLVIEITADERFITVTNNLQEKMTKEASTGIGLNNIRNRYAILFNVNIEVHKSINQYIVRLPVINSVS